MFVAYMPGKANALLAAGEINVLRAPVSSLPASLASFYVIVPNVDNTIVLSFFHVFTGGTFYFLVFCC